MIQSLNKVSVEKSKKKASWKLKGFKHLTCYRGITIAIVFIFNLLQIICIDILWLCMTKKKKGTLSSPYHYLFILIPYFIFLVNAHLTIETNLIYCLTLNPSFVQDLRKKMHTYTLFSFCHFKSWYLESTTKAWQKKKYQLC